MSEPPEFGSTNGAADTPPADNILSTLTSIVPAILTNYKDRINATKDLVAVEWQLTVRCIVLAAILAICAFSLLLVSWFGLIGLLSYGLYLTDLSPGLIIAIVILLHVLIIAWLIAAIRNLTAEVGFKRSWSSLTQSSGDDGE